MHEAKRSAGLTRHAGGDEQRSRSRRRQPLAVVREGRLVLRNRAWDALGRRTSRGSWCDAATDAPLAARSLDELALAFVRTPGGPQRFRHESGRLVELFATERAGSWSIEARTRRPPRPPEAVPLQASKAALEALGEVASGVAHDVNNALNVLSLRVDVLRASPALAQSAAFMDPFRRIIADCAATVSRLEDVARRRRDRPSDVVDLGGVVLHAVEMARLAYARAGALGGHEWTLGCRVSPDLPGVRGDAHELAQVFLNLLLNARDAMPRGGQVVVSAEAARDEVLVTVCDEGTGIAPGNLERIFEPFFTTKGRRGTGLGLSIARSVMERHGGSIRARNATEGGAILTLAFPAASPSSPRAREPQTQARARPRRVLVVDDDPANRDALTTLLSAQGHETCEAAGGAEAVEALATQAFDVVLCDLGMPVVNGWKLAEAVAGRWPGTRVILVTAWAREIAATDPRRRWVEAVLPKPIDWRRLDEALARP